MEHPKDDLIGHTVWQTCTNLSELATAYSHPCEQVQVEAEWYRLSLAIDQILAARDAFVMSRAPAFLEAAE